jgi:ATP-dependent Clp protease adaptor protein ClpS
MIMNREETFPSVADAAVADSVWASGGDVVTAPERVVPPWNVVIFNDPVNLMQYVTLVIQRVFGYPKGKAESMMLDVHQKGKCVVWSGPRERAEHYTQLLQSHQLLASMQKAD